MGRAASDLRSMGLYSYALSGLTVASEVVLPGASPASGGPQQADVSIRRAPVPDALTNPTARGPTWQMAARHFLIHVPGVARFYLYDGRSIAFEAAAGADPDDVPIFILGTVFGILLHQRGQIVLHASAVEVGGKAILFCGTSGAGKSTLAAALAQRGLPLVTDDLCALSLGSDGAATVHPDGRRLRLWSQTIDELALGSRRGGRMRARLEKYYVEPDGVREQALPLGAIYALREARPPHHPGITAPNVVDAALTLRRHAYRPRLINRMGQDAAYFHAATAIANGAGIFHLTRSLNFKALPIVLAQLEQHWRDIGLCRRAA
ncbi:MAG: hypothetical protein JSR61_13025 [Proteobacteria bacterium]|nr:hypothetical protein [Pseudomonadota bacterium]